MEELFITNFARVLLLGNVDISADVSGVNGAEPVNGLGPGVVGAATHRTRST